MFKLFITFIYASILASVVLAQDAVITKPKNGDLVPAKSKIPVRITKQSTSSKDVSIEIRMTACVEAEGKVKCPDASSGDILLTHSYEPTLHMDSNRPYEDFEVTLPPWLVGPAQLSVKHVYEVSGKEFVEYLDTTVSVI